MIMLIIGNTDRTYSVLSVSKILFHFILTKIIERHHYNLHLKGEDAEAEKG